LRLVPIMDNGWICHLVSRERTTKVAHEEADDTNKTKEIKEPTKEQEIERTKLLTEEEICKWLHQWSKLRLTKKDAARYRQEQQLQMFDKSYASDANYVDEVRQNCDRIVELSTTIIGATHFLATLPDKLNINKAISETDKQIGFALTDAEKENVINTTNLVMGFISQSLDSEKYSDIAANIIKPPRKGIAKQRLAL